LTDKTEVPAFSIIRAEDREPRLLELLQPTAPAGVARRYDWLYRDNPHGRGVAWMAVRGDTGEAMGCTAIFPRRMLVEGRPRMGSIGGDAFVRPRYRRMGIATALHRAVLAGMASEGVDFMYGPPRTANLHALVKAGSRVVAWLGRWVRPLVPSAIGRGGGRPTVPERIARPAARMALRLLDVLSHRRLRAVVEPVSAFGDEFDLLAARASAGHRIVAVRDAAYLRWRYLCAPARRQVPLAVRIEGTLVGLVAVEVAGHHAALVDIFTAPDAAVIDAALGATTQWARSAGCAVLEASLIRGSPTARRLRGMGFLARDAAAFQLAASDADPDLHVLGEAGAWHFTLGDQDMDAEVNVLPPA
jgi:GNAT superfamily N-acetyltransferase